MNRKKALLLEQTTSGKAIGVLKCKHRIASIRGKAPENSFDRSNQ